MYTYMIVELKRLRIVNYHIMSSISGRKRKRIASLKRMRKSSFKNLKCAFKISNEELSVFIGVWSKPESLCLTSLIISWFKIVGIDFFGNRSGWGIHVQSILVSNEIHFCIYIVLCNFSYASSQWFKSRAKM